MKLLAHNYQPSLSRRVSGVFPSLDTESIRGSEQFLERLETNLTLQLRKAQLAVAGRQLAALKAQLNDEGGEIFQRIRSFFEARLGNPDVAVGDCERAWQELCDELSGVRQNAPHFEFVRAITARIENCGASIWATELRTLPTEDESDQLIPENWRDAWLWSRQRGYLESIDGRCEILRLSLERRDAELALANEYEKSVENRTWLRLVKSLNPRIIRAIVAYVQAINAMTLGGRGRRDPQLRRAAREAMAVACSGVPCWIMPHWRISEALPADLGVFDLVILDEASQSDAWAIPAVVRGKQVLVVGDDKQVGPNPSFTTQAQIDLLLEHLRKAEVPTSIRTCLDPKQSIYDLSELVFAGHTICLREHFRCAQPIIEFSNALCYNGEIKCVRVPTATERMLPTLVDVHVKSGYRDPRRKINRPEAAAIVDARSWRPAR